MYTGLFNGLDGLVFRMYMVDKEEGTEFFPMRFVDSGYELQTELGDKGHWGP